MSTTCSRNQRRKLAGCVFRHGDILVHVEHLDGAPIQPTGRDERLDELGLRGPGSNDDPGLALTVDRTARLRRPRRLQPGPCFEHPRKSGRWRGSKRTVGMEMATRNGGLRKSWAVYYKIRMMEHLPDGLIDAPGLVDLQLNGFAGIDFSDPDLEPEAAISLLPALWATGVTSFCPTLITNTHEGLVRNFRVLEKARAADRRFAQMTPCYHLEGPYISREAQGVHRADCIRPPDWEEFAKLQEAAGGRIGIVTLAPEAAGAIQFTRRARAAGVVVALGHTMADGEVIRAVVEAGAELSTHLGNGCPLLLDRHHNPIWPQLHLDGLMASIICDGFHLPPDIARVIWRMKGRERTILVTDAVHVAMLKPGLYSILGIAVRLLDSGKIIRADGGSLAGSSVTMLQAVEKCMWLCGASLEDALQAAALNPAALLRRAGVVCSTGESGSGRSPGSCWKQPPWRVSWYISGTDPDGIASLRSSATPKPLQSITARSSIRLRNHAGLFGRRARTLRRRPPATGEADSQPGAAGLLWPLGR